MMKRNLCWNPALSILGAVTATHLHCVSVRDEALPHLILVTPFSFLLHFSIAQYPLLKKCYFFSSSFVFPFPTAPLRLPSGTTELCCSLVLLRQEETPCKGEPPVLSKPHSPSHLWRPAQKCSAVSPFSHTHWVMPGKLIWSMGEGSKRMRG